MDQGKKPRFKRKHGGNRQRLQKAKMAKAKESALYALLMNLMALGFLSPTTCHKVAQAAAKDINDARNGFEFSDLEGLASVVHGKNVLGRLERMLKQQSDLPLPLKTDMQFIDGPGEAHIMLPHEIFAAYFKDPQRWPNIFPSQEVIQKFWQKFQHHPCMFQHPVLSRSDFKTSCIPLQLHGDEVPVVGVGKIWSRSASSFSWSSILAQAAGMSTVSTMQYLWAVFEKFATPDGMSDFWSIVAWSFNAIYQGKYPEVDHRNVPSLAFTQVNVIQRFCFECLLFVKMFP